MQYLNTTLWETLYETVSARVPDAFPENPKITVIDENWQRSKLASNHLILLDGHLEIMNHRRQRLS